MYQCKLKKMLVYQKSWQNISSLFFAIRFKTYPVSPRKTKDTLFDIRIYIQRNSRGPPRGVGNIIIPKFTDHILISSFLDSIMVGCEFMNEKAMNLQKFLHKFEQCIRSQRINSMVVTAINLIHLN